MTYTSAGGHTLLVKVTDRHGRSVKLDYSTGASPTLTSIIDAANLGSSLVYGAGPSQVLRRLTTPYGDTDFTFYEGLAPFDSWRAVRIVENGLRTSLYLYADETDKVPASYAAWRPVTAAGPTALPNTFDDLDSKQAQLLFLERQAV